MSINLVSQLLCNHLQQGKLIFLLPFWPLPHGRAWQFTWSLWRTQEDLGALGSQARSGRRAEHFRGKGNTAGCVGGVSGPEMTFFLKSVCPNCSFNKWVPLCTGNMWKGLWIQQMGCAAAEPLLFLLAPHLAYSNISSLKAGIDSYLSWLICTPKRTLSMFIDSWMLNRKVARFLASMVILPLAYGERD